MNKKGNSNHVNRNKKKLVATNSENRNPYHPVKDNAAVVSSLPDNSVTSQLNMNSSLLNDKLEISSKNIDRHSVCSCTPDSMRHEVSKLHECCQSNHHNSGKELIRKPSYASQYSGESNTSHMNEVCIGDNDDYISDDYDTSTGAAAESQHFSNVCHAFSNYSIDSMRDVSRMESHFYSLSSEDQLLLMDKIPDRIAKIKKGVLANQQFLDLILVDHDNFEAPPADSYNNYSFNPSGTDGKTSSSTDQCTNKNACYEKDQFQTTKQLGLCEASTNETGKNSIPLRNNNKKETIKTTKNETTIEGSRDSSRKSHTGICSEISRARNSSKVRSTLRQFVRDWSDEGKSERSAAYGPLLKALEENIVLETFIEKNGRLPRILCPGSGLGRLPFEVVSRGYGCQGNEFSYFMLLGSNLILNSNIPVKSCTIYPYCLSTSNRMGHDDNLVTVQIPDVSPIDAVQAGHDFSMCAGEFVEVYWEQEKHWDGILTCFFIDTAKNVLQYIRTIARILPTGGLWANLGPLLYHFSEMPNEISIELSWEEIRLVILQFFNIIKEEWHDAYYTTNSRSMMQVQYHCIHFVAIRNNVEMTGMSHPVF